MELELATTAFVTLFVIIDPIGLTPLFVSLTSGMTTRQRRGVAVRALVTAASILAVFGIGGEFVLAKIGIGMPAFRVSGGILLFLTAIDMLFERRTPRREKTAEDDEGPDPAIFPLAMPLLAGPGAMTTMILLVGQNSGDLTSQLTVYGVMLAVLSIAFLLFMTSGMMERALGNTGINLVTRLMGMFLAALSVQFVLDGLREYGMFGL
ncbi:MarC family transcriptional regulator [Rhodobacterales bacterium 52_120_T64]|mgnify:CR=1 FL=1|nr:MarC family transcriptional regulator [Rhodobacterales bacterium 52_120_T64]